MIVTLATAKIAYNENGIIYNVPLLRVGEKMCAENKKR